MPLDHKRIRLICFDIDGTLADTDNQMVERLAKFLPFPKRHKLARTMIMAIETPANHVLHILDKVGMDEWLYRIRDRFLPTHRKHLPVWTPIDGVKETLISITSVYSLAIISARDEYLTQSFIHQMGLSNLIKCWASSETTLHTKPFPDPILWVAEHVGFHPRECLMVGDTTVDILAGKAAGAQTVGVISGFGEAEELWAAGADEVIRDVNELVALLNSSI